MTLVTFALSVTVQLSHNLMNFKNVCTRFESLTFRKVQGRELPCRRFCHWITICVIYNSMESWRVYLQSFACGLRTMCSLRMYTRTHTYMPEHSQVLLFNLLYTYCID